MAQFGRPSTDTTRTGWTDQAGGTTSIFAAIDETAANDADYIKTAAPPGTNVYVTKLTSVEDPLNSTGHIVRARAAKSATGGAQMDLAVQLRQGYVSEASQGTLIATLSQTNVTDVFTTYAVTLSGVEADSISNYADLFLRFVYTAV